MPPTTAPSWWFVGAFLVLAVGAFWPIATSPYLPLVDLPEHASQIALWRAHATDPALQARYEVQLGTPYVASYLPWSALVSAGLPIEVATRVFVALNMLLVPLGLWFFLRVRGRRVEWSLLGFLLIYTRWLAFGFLPFYFTYALFLPALAAFAAWLRWSKVKYALLTMLLGLVLVMGHGLTGGLWGVSCGFLLLLARGSLRRRILWALPLLPAGAALVYWSMGRSAGVHPNYGQGIAEQWRAFAGNVIGGTTGRGFEIAAKMSRLIVIVLLAEMLVVLARRPWANSHWRRIGSAAIAVLRRFDGATLVASVVALVLYLVLPYEMFGTYYVNARLAPFAVLLFVASLPAPAWNLSRAGIVLFALVAGLAIDGHTARAYQSFNAAMGDARSLFASIPPKASVGRPMGAESSLHPLELPVLDHFHIWGQVRSLGEAATFSDAPHMLIRDAKPMPRPLFDARLQQANGQMSIVSPTGRLPDFLIFHTMQEPAASMPVVDRQARYQLWKRTGGLNAFKLEAGPEGARAPERVDRF